MQSLSSTVLVKEQELLSPSNPKSLLRINLPPCVAWSQDIQRKKHLWNTDYRATWVFWVMGTSHKDSGWRNILTISANSGVFTISETCSQMLKVSSWCTLNLPSLPNSTPSQLSLLLKPGGLGRYGRHGTGSEESGCVPIMFFTHHSIFFINYLESFSFLWKNQHNTIGTD